MEDLEKESKDGNDDMTNEWKQDDMETRCEREAPATGIYLIPTGISDGSLRAS